MSRMNRVLFTAGVLLMLVSSAAMAFEGFPNPVRSYTLTGGDAFNANFISDSNDAYTWFGRIYRNADHVRVTWWPSSTAQGLGLIKSEESYGAYMLHLQEGSFYDKQLSGEYNHFTLGYGYAFENFDLGVVYNRQGTSQEVGGTKMSETYNAFGAGITYDMDDETQIDATFAFVTGKTDDGVDGNDDPESTGMNFGARAFKAWREDLTIVPVFVFNTWKDKLGDAEDKTTMFGAGLGFDYTINEDNDLYVFASFQNSKETLDDGTDTAEYKMTALPGIGAAVEHEFTDMFTVRMGATKNWEKYEEPGTPDGTDTYHSYPWMFTMGMGIAMGDWVIDLELNQTWLYSAGYWFHGYDSPQSPIAQIEAKLWF
ncbi:MAG: hypothetical protein H6694_03155 [Candidatus Latescibacteria bacterium]|nr:hypothetical protein [bacterium]MCB9513295.1 hypothetical protein [Candidatus Latescibacterota bacterium]